MARADLALSLTSLFSALLSGCGHSSCDDFQGGTYMKTVVLTPDEYAAWASGNPPAPTSGPAGTTGDTTGGDTTTGDDTTGTTSTTSTTGDDTTGTTTSTTGDEPPCTPSTPYTQVVSATLSGHMPRFASYPGGYGAADATYVALFSKYGVSTTFPLYRGSDGKWYADPAHVPGAVSC
mgnify:CR=1 FL=1